jgi:hypothetical protein
MVEADECANAREVKRLQVVGSAGCVGCHGYGLGCLPQEHNLDVLPTALVARKPRLGCGWPADMAADSPPAIGAKGGKCAGGGGGAVKGNFQSWGPLVSRQPLSMGWPLGW